MCVRVRVVVLGVMCWNQRALPPPRPPVRLPSTTSWSHPRRPLARHEASFAGSCGSVASAVVIQEMLTEEKLWWPHRERGYRSSVHVCRNGAQATLLLAGHGSQNDSPVTYLLVTSQDDGVSAFTRDRLAPMCHKATPTAKVFTAL